MTKYRVLAQTATFFELFIEAKNDEEAWKLAEEADLNSFAEIGDSADWEIYDVHEYWEPELLR